MAEEALASLNAWLVAPLDGEVSAAIERLRRAPDVRRVAVMPDVHLGTDVCIGVAIGTTHLLYPQAVGGDIGCGVLAVPFDAGADRLSDPTTAGRVLAALGRAVPARRWNRRELKVPPPEVAGEGLSDLKLEALFRRDGIAEFATLGSGNHFAELQADEEERLWLMVHSGSRAMGPQIRDHHLARAAAERSGLKALDAGSAEGRAYLADAAWARRYARENRRAIALNIARVLGDAIGATLDWSEAISSDHNHVMRESHGGVELLVHRKGAMAAARGEKGALPGSMGTASFHVEGRGCAEALCSSAHGAGRLLSRTAARERVTARELERQMRGVWYDFRRSGRLRDEAPAAYKDIRRVARAQGELVKVVRALRPILNYKGD